MTKTKKKSHARLNREIAESLARQKKSRKRHHATVQEVPAGDAWDIAMDALLEHDPKRAAQIVNQLKSEDPDAAMPPAFSKTLGKVPEIVRDGFEQATDLVSKYGYDWPGFAEGAAFGFWVSPYMSEVENLAETAREQDNDDDGVVYMEAYRALSPGAGGRWESVLPPVPAAARALAKKFANATLDQLTDEQLSEVAGKFSPYDAGYYGAMQSQGEGVGWYDEGVKVEPPRGFGDDVKIGNAIYAAIRRGAREAGIRLPR